MKKCKACMVFFLIAACIIILSGCNETSDAKVEASSQENTGDEIMSINIQNDMPIIETFKYFIDYHDGGGVSYSTGISSNGDIVINYYRAEIEPTYKKDNNVSIPLTVKQYEELVKVIDNYDLRSWDGFNDDSTQGIEGGGKFNVEIKWSDGSSVTAYSKSGQMEVPKNFYDADLAIKDFFSQFNSLAYPSPQSSD